ncbi:MAG: PTS glucose transporter subunit IIBC, partial [Oscillospiraceae bacterium]
FLAPVLYFTHAVLTGISVAIVAALPIRAGFQFSAGFVDWFLSFKAPFAMNPPAADTHRPVPFSSSTSLVFRIIIIKLDLKTRGP